MTISAAGAVNQFSVLGCLPNCFTGNQLALTFSIPASQLNGAGVSASAIPGHLPLDLLEDNGDTDIHGTVATYSHQNASATSVPEPVTWGLLGSRWRESR